MKRLILLLFVLSSIVAIGQRRYLGIPSGAATPSSYTALVAGDLPAGSSHYWLTTGTSTLTGNTTITGTTRPLSFNTNSFEVNENGGGTFINSRGGGTFIQSETGGIFIQSNVGFTGGGINIGRSINNAGGINIQDRNFLNLTSRDASGTSRFNLLLDGINGDAIFTDGTASPKGLRYNASGYVTDARSLTDKGYVDAAIATAGGAFVTTSTTQTGLSGAKTWTNNHTWSYGGGSTQLTQTRTANFSTTDALNSWNNNTNTLVSQLASNGVHDWILYNSSGTRVGAISNSFTANGPIIAMNNAGITTRFDIRYNGTNNNLVLLNNTNNLNTHVVVGAESAKIGSEMFLVKGDQNVPTVALVHNATNNTGANAAVSISSGAANANAALILQHLSPNYTTSNMLQAGRAIVYSTTSNGLNVGTQTNSSFGFWTNNAYRGQFLNTGQLLIGTNATAAISSEAAQIRVDQNNATYLLINNATNGTNATARVSLSAGAANDTNPTLLIAFPAAFTPSGMNQASKGALIFNNVEGGNIGTSQNKPLQLYTNNISRGQYLNTGEFLTGPSASALISSETMQIRNDQNASTFLLVNNATNNTLASASITVNAGDASLGQQFQIRSTAPSFTPSGINEAGKSIINSNATNGLNIGTVQNTSVNIWTNTIARGSFAAGGGFVIGSTTLSADAILEGVSTTKGFRPPTMTTTQRNAISSPATALMVGNSTTNTIDWYNGTTWASLGGIGGSTGSLDNAVVGSDGSGGSTVQQRPAVIDDSGNTTLGLSGTSGTERVISTDGSGSNVDLFFKPKGGLQIKNEAGLWHLADNIASPTIQVVWQLATTNGDASGATTSLTMTRALDMNLPTVYMSDLRMRTQIRLKGYTFTTLPGSPTTGWLAYITDCNTTTFNANAAGGGSNTVMVFYDGTNWKVH